MPRGRRVGFDRTLHEIRLAQSRNARAQPATVGHAVGVREADQWRRRGLDATISRDSDPRGGLADHRHRTGRSPAIRAVSSSDPLSTTITS